MDPGRSTNMRAQGLGSRLPHLRHRKRTLHIDVWAELAATSPEISPGAWSLTQRLVDLTVLAPVIAAIAAVEGPCAVKSIKIKSKTSERCSTQTVPRPNSVFTLIYKHETRFVKRPGEFSGLVPREPSSALQLLISAGHNIRSCLRVYLCCCLRLLACLFSLSRLVERKAFQGRW